MTTRICNILLLRHGLTDANAGSVIQGHQPTPLNALGHQQARRLAERLANYDFPLDVLISSDLPRAVQTAQPIAAACGRNLLLDARWRERCFGEFEGTSAAERDIWRAAAGEIDPPGAESAAAFTGRIHAALTGLSTDHPDVRTIGVVTHGGPCRAVLGMLLDGRLPLAEGQTPPERTMIANCSILHLIERRTEGKTTWSIARLNDVAHLIDLGPTVRDVG